MFKLKVIKFLLDTFKKLYSLLIISFVILVLLGELELITEIGGIQLYIIGTNMLFIIIFAPVLRLMISFFTNWDYDIAYMDRKNSSSTRTTYSYSNSYASSYEVEEDDYKSNNTKKNYHSEEVKEKKYLEPYSAMNLGMSAEDIIKYNIGDYDTVMKYQETALHIDKTDIFFGG